VVTYRHKHRLPRKAARKEGGKEGKKREGEEGKGMGREERKWEDSREEGICTPKKNKNRCLWKYLM